jgi:hypothetical protein
VYWVSRAVPDCPFLLQVLEPRDHDGQQLHDDARRDVRHDAQREDRQLQQRSAAEQVDQAVQPAAGVALSMQSWTAWYGHAGRGDDRASRNRAMIAIEKRIFREGRAYGMPERTR